jgi:hypothetical protein
LGKKEREKEKERVDTLRGIVAGVGGAGKCAMARPVVD